MSQQLVLVPYVSGAQPSEHLPAGTIIDTTQFPDFASMVAGGLSVIPYDSASQDAAIAAFNAQRTNPGASLLVVLVAAGIPMPPSLRDKFILAFTTTVHSKINLRGMAALVALPGGTIQSVVDTRVEALRTIALAHGAAVGTPTVDGEHKAADTTNDGTLAAIPAAVDLASCIVVINGLLAWLNAHRTQAGVHFNNDGTAYAITTNPPTTLPHCVTDANDMLTNFLAHFALGQPPSNA